MSNNPAKEPLYHNPSIYTQVIQQIEDIFHIHEHELEKIKELAQRIKKGIEKISPFIQQSTESVCPTCTNVCCVNKHGYYTYEDLIYIYALGLRPLDYDFEKKDSNPCHFLSEKGCIMDRPVRPSGCNWYFCGLLLDHMEERTGYEGFDDDLRDIAKLWLELIDKFTQIFPYDHL